MKALVIGANGTIGNAVVQNLKKSGYELMAASRSSDLKVDIENTASIDALFQNTGNFDVMICAAGSLKPGKLNSLTDADFVNSVNSKLLGQVNLVRRGLSFLNPKGVIVLTGGLLAYNPWPGTSTFAMVNAGLEGFVRAVATELTDGKRICIVHPPMVAESAIARGMDGSVWPNAHAVSEVYMEAVNSYKNGIPLFVNGYSPK